MVNQFKNMLIGLFVVIACCLIVGIILFLEPTVGDGKQTFIVRFSNINGLNVGTRVLFAGKAVGEAVEIEQIPNAREQPTDNIGQVYYYQLILHVDSSVHVFNTDEITVQTSGLLGEKSIAIIPRAAPKGVKPRLIEHTEALYAESIDPLENAFNVLGDLSEKVEEALDKVITWVDQNGDNLGLAVRTFDQTMAQVNLAVRRINELDMMGGLNQTIDVFKTTLGNAEAAFNELKQKEAFTKLGDMLGNFETASAFIAKGQGTLGKFIQNEDFYLRMNAILSKMDTLMNDINHFGILFNLNKQWQRMRVKRISTMNSLMSPENFKSYFESEIDLINTSMARLSMLLEKAENEPNTDDILKSTPFKKDFRALLYEIDSLSNNLKLYNERLVEIQGD